MAIKDWKKLSGKRNRSAQWQRLNPYGSVIVHANSQFYKGGTVTAKLNAFPYSEIEKHFNDRKDAFKFARTFMKKN